ncbi:Hypothetical_protein [Hexamita inflata]|uniref:Hypothetical_protein n=1 Tax=Hexamita inflata TaxID=28002 RepID=A0AA86RNU7_9EUKA|nr:Hypothetical protein HINF_LOCUS14585 [Hexamita inflata]CAI9975272.1 Hypothetical protein HINF_LOCUS62917 [Hexamita inflata]
MDHSKCEKQFVMMNKELLMLHQQLKDRQKLIDKLQNDKIKMANDSKSQKYVADITHQVFLEQMNIKYQEENQRLKMALECQLKEFAKQDKLLKDYENQISFLQTKQFEIEDEHKCELQQIMLRKVPDESTDKAERDSYPIKSK